MDASIPIELQQCSVHQHRVLGALQEWDPGISPPLAAAPVPAWQWMGKHSMAGFTGTLDSALLEAEWKLSMLKLAVPVPTRQEPDVGILRVLQPLSLWCCSLPHWFLLSPSCTRWCHLAEGASTEGPCVRKVGDGIPWNLPCCPVLCTAGMEQCR